MKRCLLWLIVMVVVSGQASAAFSLPEECKQFVPEVEKFVTQDATDSYGLSSGAAELFNRAVAETRRYILSGVRAVAAIMLGVILLGVVESFANDRRVRRYTTVVGALWITAVSAGDMSALIGLGRETITKVTELSKLLIPVLATATAAAGGVTAASVRQVGTVMFSNLLLAVIEQFMIPALYLYIGTAAAASVLEGNVMERIGSFIKKSITWCLGTVLAVFTTYLSVSGAIAGQVDAQTVRVAKTAVSAAVPIVGGILAGAAESVLAGAGVLRGMVGVFGALAVLSLCLAPFLRLGTQYLLYQAAGFVTLAAGPEKLTKLLSTMGDAFALMLAMTGSCALVLIISLVSTLTVVAS